MKRSEKPLAAATSIAKVAIGDISHWPREFPIGPMARRVLSFRSVTSSSTHRLSQVERAMAQLADTLRSLQAEEQLRRNEQQARDAKQQAEQQARDAKQQAEQQARDAKQQARDEKRDAEQLRWNHEKGEIARKLGTVVEDIVAPSIPRVVADVFGLEENPLDRFAIREVRVANGERREFDAVAAWPGHFLINETKSKLRPEDVPLFVEMLRGARRFFPEYQDRKLVGALATLNLEPSLVRYIERQGIIVMALGDDLMEAKNSPGFRPAEF
jgi:flagellar biosynthesis GTPase FlhF